MDCRAGVRIIASSMVKYGSVFKVFMETDENLDAIFILRDIITLVGLHRLQVMTLRNISFHNFFSGNTKIGHHISNTNQ